MTFKDVWRMECFISIHALKWINCKPNFKYIVSISIQNIIGTSIITIPCFVKLTQNSYLNRNIFKIHSTLYAYFQVIALQCFFFLIFIIRYVHSNLMIRKNVHVVSKFALPGSVKKVKRTKDNFLRDRLVSQIQYSCSLFSLLIRNQ